MMEGHTGMQQTAAESTLFAQQTGLAFHRWPFLGHSFGDANYTVPLASHSMVIVYAMSAKVQIIMISTYYVNKIIQLFHYSAILLLCILY